MKSKKDTLQSLYNRRNYLHKKLKSLCPFLRGSIVEYKSTCGKPNCRCKRGYLHTSTYLSITIEGKTQMLCLPKKEPKIKKEAISWCSNYKRAKEIMEELTLINLSILKERIRSSRASRSR
jgi:hypothetical protein